MTLDAVIAAHWAALIPKPLRVGDRLVANRCDVTVRECEDRFGSGWCRNCKSAHVLDVRLFNAGRGPWRRTGSGDAA